MQPPPRTAPSGAVGPPPPSSGTNAFRRNRPHKHGVSHAWWQSESTTNSNPLPMQGTPVAGFNSIAPPTRAQAASPGPPPRIFTPQPIPPGPAQSSNPPSTEPGYFYSQEPMPYIAQLPNPAPHLHFNPSHPASLPQHPQFKHQLNFSPSPRLFIPTGYPITVAAHLQFKTTFSLPVICHLSLSILMPHPLPPSPHLPPPFSQSQNQGLPAPTNMTGPNGQQNSHYPAQSYFSQSAAPLEPWFNQNPPQHASPVPHPEAPSDPGTLSMFFRGNDVENVETLSGEGRVNGVSHPLHSMTELSGPYLNDSGNIRAGAGPCDSVENLECVPNQEVLPSEPPPSHAFEVGPNLETPDTAPRLARSASVSSSYSNVSHSSGHGPHSGGHAPRRHQGLMGTFIQQESPRPSEHPPLHPSTGGYFEQIDSNPAVETSPTFPTPSPPKPVGVFQASANSSFEPFARRA
ncbi:Protein transport protein [Triplophysa tibetana]|uniref:Protein transport protein n=1 Tax=Triplophysa tibetana TaxID=1572043 RepID=A0A5A9PBD6_9TELE|nr:Protein transport protein [Triplophysa tibetana]